MCLFARTRLLVLVACWPAVIAVAQTPVGLPSLDEVMARDAQLHDLSFVDARNGWAVGDRGVILRTTDGGRRWRRLESPVDCPLYSVAFTDSLNGFAVGGFTKPYTHTSHAVVLATQDGGETWRQKPADTLPLLRRVRFFNPRHGVAAGSGAAFAPSGVFETQDAGRTWRTLPASELSQWCACDFLAPGVGVAVGAAGNLAVVDRGGVEQTGALAGDRRGIHDVKLARPNAGWLVGDGGLLLTTRDQGQTWRPPTRRLPAAAVDRCDWRAVATDGPRLWVVGEPGSVVLHSPDAGQSWRLQPTGITAPLQTVAFVDAMHGWAAGTLGTILATDDGGRTWRVQRQGGTRTSVAFVVPNIENTPLAMVASMAAAEGHLASIDLPFAMPPASGQSNEQARLIEAATASGAAVMGHGWRLQLRPQLRTLDAEGLLAEFNRQTRGRAMAELEEPFVARLRTLKPDVVVLAAADAQQLSGEEAIILSALKRAMEAAGDPSAHADLAALGLSPHKVQRLVIAAPATRQASPKIAAGDFLPALGTSPAQWVSTSRGLIAEEYQPAPEAVTWRTALDTAAPLGGQTPMAGIAVARGRGARRPASRPPAGELAALRDVAQKQRAMQTLLSQTEVSDAWIGQAAGLTSGLEPDTGAALLYELADGYRRAGKLALAGDTFYLLARRYTNHPLADSAIVWLLRYYASGEAAQAAANRVQQQDKPPLANITSGTPPAAPPTLADTGGVLDREERLSRASQLGDYLEQARPALFADPAMRFPIAAAHRGLGRPADAEKQTVVFIKQAVAPSWRRCALAERWLAGDRQTPPPKPTATCLRTADRPLLDGAFDEPFWQNAKRLPLGGEAPDAATVRLACDDEFFYLAIDCPRSPGATAPPATPRPRDGDLTKHDRVAIQIDTDRDYASAFELTIDARGWTADRCWGDRRWDPRWFVASGGAAGRWTAEAAIPLAELTPRPPADDDAWAVSAVRHSPGRADTTWTTSADRHSPDRFGLLLFK